MAGLLGQIFSAGNVAKRQLRDLLGNPVLGAQQMAGNLNDRARNLNEMTSAAAREGMDYGPATQRLAGLMAEGYNPVGMVSRVAPKSLDELARKYPDVKIDAFVGKDDINLSRIVVPKEMRNQGIGTQVMGDLSEFADSLGKRITLTPSADFGGSVPKLKTFYKELGFVENKGKNKDFSTREAMYREPQAASQQVEADSVNQNSVQGLLGANQRSFETSLVDASDIFGQGAKRIKYTDPNSGGVIDVLQRPDGTASVLGLEVPEAMRGQGIGQSLQSQVMQDFPEMMGQVSSKAAAKTAYRLGRRPPNQPDATLDDVYKIMDEYSSVNLVSPDMQKRFMQSLLD